MKKLKKLFIFSILFLFPSLLHAETQTGTIRSINCDASRSFGLDVPPLIRVYFNAGTRFEKDGGQGSCQDIQEGDRVEVDLRSLEPGTAFASRVKKLGSAAPVKDLASNEITIKLYQSFLMGVSQTAVLKEGDKILLKLRSNEFINTLCKQGYDCGGEGEVGMRLEVSKDKEKNEILLISKNGRKPIEPVKVNIFGYEIQLIEVGEDVVMLVVRTG